MSWYAGDTCHLELKYWKTCGVHLARRTPVKPRVLENAAQLNFGFVLVKSIGSVVVQLDGLQLHSGPGLCRAV